MEEMNHLMDYLARNEIQLSAIIYTLAPVHTSFHASITDTMNLSLCKLGGTRELEEFTGDGEVKSTGGPRGRSPKTDKQH